MTRQSRARWLAFATASLVVLLAAVFAALRNLYPAHGGPPADRPAVAQPPAPASASAAAGRAAFADMGCTLCHRAEGQGNPSLPLDGVGGRLDRKQLREAAFGLGVRGESMPAGVRRAKQGHAEAPGAEPLLDYLQQLR